MREHQRNELTKRVALILDEPAPYAPHLDAARGRQKNMSMNGRIRAAPGSGGTLNRGPNHSLGTSKEGYVKPTRICDFDGCTAPHLAKGLCQGHWEQQHKGQELRPLRSQITPEQRFWPKVDKSAPGGCWEWTGSADQKGYGHFRIRGSVVRAHRVSWEFANGAIPKGMFLDHRCANKRCVNPGHLRVVTNAQNMQHRIGATRNSNSGIRGVCWDKRANAWRARAYLNGRAYWGGYHSTLEAAETAAKALRVELFTHDDHDEWVHNQEGAA